MPLSSKHFLACFSSRSILIPAYSKRSALPDLLEIDLLPCFAIFTPAAAATMADAVDMLKVF